MNFLIKTDSVEHDNQVYCEMAVQVAGYIERYITDKANAIWSLKRLPTVKRLLIVSLILV